MPFFLRPALLLAFVLPAYCQEPRKDPFLAPDEEILRMIPRTFSVAQVSVQLDWIRLPHLTANQLIRQHLKHSSDGPALYKVTLDLIAQKKAERLDMTTTLVRGGQRSKNETTVEHPYPTEFDPPQVNKRVLLDGDPAWNRETPAAPTRFATKNTGRSFEVEATVGEDRNTIDLNLAPEWIEHLADMSWGTGASELKQPVFGTNKLTSQMLMKNGEWHIAGLFTPPHGAPEGKLYGSAEVLPAERVLLFVRASMDAPPKPVPPEAVRFPVRQVMVLAEWIEVDMDTAAGLLVKHPAFADTAAIRETLEPMLLDGRASLLESSALQIRSGQRSKIESVTQYPYPTEFDPAQLPHETVESPKKVDPPPQPPAPLPATASAFAIKNLGTTMEVEATVGEDGFTIDLNLQPSITYNLGTVTYGEGVSAVKQPKFQTMQPSLQLLTFPNSPSMIGSYDAPLREGQSPPAVKSRKVLLFVRAIL